jgi:hypothetical protein
MRAITGAIITAGALIGLGLAAIGLGNRYQGVAPTEYLRWRTLDTPLEMVLILLIACVIIGLGLTFVGLSYHHERRQREIAREGLGPESGRYPGA